MLIALLLAAAGVSCVATSDNAGLCTKWGSWKEIDRLLQPGDLVEFSRTPVSGLVAYKHWAVYVGHVNNRPIVIHYSTPAATQQDESWLAGWIPASLGSLNSATGLKEIMGDVRVREDPLEIVASGSLCRINNKQDRIDAPFEPHAVVKRARGKLGEAKYHLFNNNCEHFSKFVRNDVSISLQAAQLHRPMRRTYFACKFIITNKHQKDLKKYCDVLEENETGGVPNDRIKYRRE